MVGLGDECCLLQSNAGGGGMRNRVEGPAGGLVLYLALITPWLSLLQAARVAKVRCPVMQVVPHQVHIHPNFLL